MTIPSGTRTPFEKWQDGISSAIGNPKWSLYDCEIKIAVSEFNQHLANTAGYRQLDWQLIKAMLWTETGASSADWKIRPMQIGVPGDPGLASLLSGKEGGELILPPSWKGRLTAATARSIPSHNIRAGTGYLLMRMASFDYKSIPASDTAAIHEMTVRPGDSLAKIAKASGSTTEILRNLNTDTMRLHPGQTLKYQQGSVQRFITGWRPLTTAMISQRYNGGGDANYAKKLDYALSLIRKGKEALCK